MYNKIYEFCKVRNLGNIYHNSSEPTPRVKFLLELLDSEGIKYELDKFPIHQDLFNWSYRFRFVRNRKYRDKMNKPKYGYNIILKGNSNRMVVAHHDIANPNIDNANDNSASVINAIVIKKAMPHINVVLLDGEECGGIGSQRCSDLINEGKFGNIDWVLNLELTGKGGKYFFIGNYPGKLFNHIKSLFNCPVFHTPYNDSVTFRKNAIDSCVINPLPPVNEGESSSIMWNENTYLDHKLLFNCHSFRDTLNSISVQDMQEFVEQVVLKILA